MRYTQYRGLAQVTNWVKLKFAAMEGIETGFREFMQANDFAEIHSPKITAISAEGGAEVFRLKYFGADATLAQSPQQYKQMCVAFFGRVFEVGPVYRAEPFLVEIEKVMLTERKMCYKIVHLKAKWGCEKQEHTKSTKKQDKNLQI